MVAVVLSGRAQPRNDGSAPRAGGRPRGVRAGGRPREVPNVAQLPIGPLLGSPSLHIGWVDSILQAHQHGASLWPSTYPLQPRDLLSTRPPHLTRMT